MHMDDKLNITVQLAGQPKVPLQINRSDEELMRKAEKLVNDLWYRWTTGNFAAESQMRVMARVAFQFAVLYLRKERDAQELKELEQSLDDMLKNLPGLE